MPTLQLHAANLFLDLGTTTGWASIRPNGQENSGTQNFAPGRYEGGGMRYVRFWAWLDEMKRYLGKIEAIYFEEVRRHIGVDAAHAYGGFMSHLTSWCETNDIPYLGVPVATIKKAVTGKGNANKAEVINAVRKLGYSPEDDNEADAQALRVAVLAGKNPFKSEIRKGCKS